MHNLIKYIDKANRIHHATVMQKALDTYLLDEIQINIINLMPYLLNNTPVICPKPFCIAMLP